MALNNGIGYAWGIKFVREYYSLVEEVFETLKEVYKSIEGYNAPLDCVYINKVEGDRYEFDFLENVKETTKCYFEPEEEED